jgi:hypothetical protein
VLNELPLSPVDSRIISANFNLRGKKEAEVTGERLATVTILDRGSEIDDEDCAYKVINGKAQDVIFSKDGEIKYLKIQLQDGAGKGRVGWVPSKHVDEMTNVFVIDPQTCCAQQLTRRDVDGSFPDGVVPASEDAKLRSNDFFIIRKFEQPELSKTSRKTIEMINDPSQCTELVRYALETLRKDAGNFGANYYVTFSKSMFEKAIMISGGSLVWSEESLDGGVDLARDTFGEFVEEVPEVLPAYHVFEALVAVRNTNARYDKVQHFSRSAWGRYHYGVLYNLVGSFREEFQMYYGNPVFKLDKQDVIANNNGYKYGDELIERRRKITK